VKIAMDPHAPPISGPSQTLLLSSLAAVEACIKGAVTVDRGHRHSDGRSTVHIWISHLVDPISGRAAAEDVVAPKGLPAAQVPLVGAELGDASVPATQDISSKGFEPGLQQSASTWGSDDVPRDAVVVGGPSGTVPAAGPHPTVTPADVADTQLVHFEKVQDFLTRSTKTSPRAPQPLTCSCVRIPLPRMM
jgi:hypothetical protein